jgi:hypothetical protein
MTIERENNMRTVPAVPGKQQIEADPAFEIDLSRHLRESYSAAGLLEQYSRFADGEGALDALMRRRSLARKFGNGVPIASGVHFRLLETFEIGDGVFIGAQAFIQGRFDGNTKIGDHVWIGPQGYFDARELILEGLFWLGSLSEGSGFGTHPIAEFSSDPEKGSTNMYAACR